MTHHTPACCLTILAVCAVSAIGGWLMWVLLRSLGLSW